MNSLTSFIKLADDETVLQEWQVLSDRGGFRAYDILIFIVFAVVLFVIQRLIWALILEGAYLPIIGPILGFMFPPIIVLLFFSWWIPPLVALALTAINVYSRPSVSGQVALSNWRLLYYEQGMGKLSRYHHAVSSVNLEDIVGVHSSFREGLWGVKNLVITIHTKHKGGLSVQIGDSGGLLGKLPLIGSWFGRNNIGPDAAALLPVAFRLVQDRRGQSTQSGLSY